MIENIKNIAVHFLKLHVVTIVLLTLWFILKKFATPPNNWNETLIILFDAIMFAILGFIIYLFDKESHHNTMDIKNNSIPGKAIVHKLEYLSLLKDYSTFLAFVVFLFIVVYGLFHVFFSAPNPVRHGVALIGIGVCTFVVLKLLYSISYSKNADNKSGDKTVRGYHIADFILYPFLFTRDTLYYFYCKFKGIVSLVLTSQGRNYLAQQFSYWFKNDTKNADVNAVRYAIIGITLSLSYIFFNMIQPSMGRLLQGVWGSYLLREPVYLEKREVVGDLHFLYGRYRQRTRKYSYSLSCWIFLDQNNAHRNYQSNYDTNIINFGSIPQLTYNPKDGKVRIWMKDTQNHKHAIYETKRFSRQYWNHVFFNYQNGTMDIFINNELVSTQNNIIPLLTRDEIVIGENDGLLGGIRDVVYTHKPRSRNMIHLIYLKERWYTELVAQMKSYFLSS